MSAVATEIDPDSGTPEPTEVDEKRHRELGHMAQDAVLRGHPSGDERCRNCLYYIDTSADLAYCWHPKLRILVGGEWWCQWWEAIAGATPDDSTVNPTTNITSAR